MSKKKIALIVVSIFFLLGLIGSAGTGSSSDGKIKIGTSSSAMKGKNYQDIESDLRTIGFTNIVLTPIEDLVTGWITKDGKIDSVTVDGKKNFSSSDKFDSTAEIVISYHTFAGKQTSENTTEQTAENNVTEVTTTQIETTTEPPTTEENTIAETEASSEPTTETPVTEQVIAETVIVVETEPATEPSTLEPETVAEIPETQLEPTIEIPATQQETSMVQPETQPPINNGSITYVLNTNTKKIHKPSCNSVKKINNENRMDVSWTFQQCVDAEYEPCGICNPR